MNATSHEMVVLGDMGFGICGDKVQAMHPSIRGCVALDGRDVLVFTEGGDDLPARIFPMSAPRQGLAGTTLVVDLVSKKLLVTAVILLIVLNGDATDAHAEGVRDRGEVAVHVAPETALRLTKAEDGGLVFGITPKGLC